MTAKILKFPSTGRPVPLPSIPPDVIELVDIDGALATVDELAALSAERLDHLPFGSERWTWELENWVGLLKERFEFEKIRERALSGGLRLVSGGKNV